MKAINGKYKNGKIELDTLPRGIEEGKVIVVFTKVKRKSEKERLKEDIKEALQEVKLMREGKIPKKTWWEAKSEL